MATNREIIIRQLVCEQLINMLENNVMNENGFEQFDGWCADGEVFVGHTHLTDECMELVKKIKDKVNDIAWELAPERD